MKKFFKEFKTFITRGNVFDMAVGLIIATAFNKIVSSMVNDVLMPLVTYFLGAKSLSELSIPLRVVDGEVTLAFAYGNFLQAMIDFLIIGFSVFIMVKIMMLSRNKFEIVKGSFTRELSKESLKKKKELWKTAKKEGKDFSKLWDDYKKEKKRLAEELKQKKAEEKRLEEEAERLAHPGEEALLMQIRDTLVQLNEKLEKNGEPQIGLAEDHKEKDN